MTASLGGVALFLAFATALAAAGVALVGRDDDAKVALARRAVYVLAGLLTLCVVLIELAFLRDDFSLELVQQHSSIATPVFYKLTAMWSSQEGSLLLWAWLLSVVSSVALMVTRVGLRELLPYAIAVLAGVVAFFTGLMLFGGGVNPFAALDPAPIDGVGLNPLLQHPSMMIHPPMLYLGYVSFTVPFAFAIGALVARRLDAAWIRATRRFALIAWAFLGVGLLLGARWSYTELGWGGYWAWDPVENAALMPWLVGTAFLHSVMVQEKRGMLKVWNASLVVATFALCLVGTFLVRSGVLESIHAFGDSTVGPYILALIATVLVGSTALIVSRLDDLRSPRRIDSLASREAIFLVNNLLLVALCAVVFWGTFFPLISELFTGETASLAAPWFDRYTTPLAVLLVLFTGIGPLLAWRRVSWETARRLFRWPAAAAALTAVVLLALGIGSSPWALGLFVVAAFALTGLAQEFGRGARARRRLRGGSLWAALLGLIAGNRRRYGGYIVHIGVIVLLIGIAASSSFQTNRDIDLRPGQSAEVEGRQITYERPTVAVDDRSIELGAVLAVRDGSRRYELRPSRRYFRPSAVQMGGVAAVFDGEATSEVGLKAGLRADLWTALAPTIAPLRRRARDADEGFGECLRGGPGTPPQCRAVGRLMRAAAAEPSLQPLALAQIRALQSAVAERITADYLRSPGTGTFRVIVDPLVSWIWIGALIAISGALIAIWPGRRRRRGAAPGSEREARKEAKYREIRDAELDHAAGKLSDEDFARIDAELRREAVELLES